MKREVAIFAAGCFWGVQYYFDQVPGVLATEAGYTGGKIENPTYEQICSNGTGHAEAVRIIYDADKVSHETLLKHFFRMHDPTQLDRQGPDIGDQYRSAIFAVNGQQQALANKVIEELNQTQYGGKIVTRLEKISTFWPAEDYHQKFTERTGRGMCHVPYQSV